MRRKKFHVGVEVILLLLSLVLFCYFRLKPIHLQSVPYTYDQGRDFLKAAEIAIGHNITFLGPTSGIQGVFHGAWWYYLLGAAHVLFAGNPQGFYYFIFTIAVLSALLFYVFLRREFGVFTGLFFMGMLASAPYFIRTSIFALNSVMTLPFILLLIGSLHLHVKRKGVASATFLMALCVGFILEFELAFGFLLAPALLLVMALTKQVKPLLGTRRKMAAAIFGFTVPLVPRILFEVKNNFMQTKSLFNFFSHPTSTHPVTFVGLLQERIDLFRSFFDSLFAVDSQVARSAVFVLALVALIVTVRKMKAQHWKVLLYCTMLVGSLYVVSLINRNNFFWDNYLEGLPYVYVFILSVVFGYLYEKGPSILRVLAVFVLGFFLVSGAQKAYADYKKQEPPSMEGLYVHTQIMEYVRDKVSGSEFCLRIYTPPVVAHTYNYITDWYVHTKGMKRPVGDFVDGKCWYIIEKDDYLERAADWRAKNIPAVAEKVSVKEFGKSGVVELWSVK